MANTDGAKFLRVSIETHERLCQFIALLSKSALADFKAGSGALPTRITVDDAIAVLLDRQESHRERSKRANERRKKPDVNDVNDVNDNAS